MKSLIASAILLPIRVGASSRRDHNPWRVVRHDYMEFCAGATLTWDLHGGTLRTVRGACDPHRDAPPTITLTKLALVDLQQLRKLSAQALDQGIGIQPRDRIPGHLLSGPVDFTVEVGRRELRSPNCMNDLGRRLEAAMATSIHRDQMRSDAR